MIGTTEERFRRLVESMLGAAYEGSVEEIAKAMNVDVNDPATWAEIERRWQAGGQRSSASSSDDRRAFDLVERAFQAVVEHDVNVFDSTVLETYPPGVRMLIATRVIEGQVDNGGWPAVFFNSVDGHISAAIEGYRLLGLDHHAALAERVQSHGWIAPDGETPDDPAWAAYEAAWFGLPDAEDARARYIRDHPGDFPT